MVIVLMVPPFYQLVLTVYSWSLSPECSFCALTYHYIVDSAKKILYKPDSV